MSTIAPKLVWEPFTYNEATRSLEVKFGKGAIDKKVKAFENNNT